MIKTNFQRLILLFITTMGLKAYAGPKVQIPATANLALAHLMYIGGIAENEIREFLEIRYEELRKTDISKPDNLTHADRGALTDIKNAFGKLAKVEGAVLHFEKFYYGDYSNLIGEDRLSPRKIAQILEYLTWVKKYLSLLSAKKYMSKMLSVTQIESLEIIKLKNSNLIDRLSLEVIYIERANQNQPEKLAALFDKLDRKNMSLYEDAFSNLTHGIARLQMLEAISKSCQALF